MKAGDIFSQTMPFVWAKLLLGLATVLVSALLFGVLMGLAWLFNSESIGGIMFIVWLSAVGVVRFLLTHYIGYLLKAGHVAVISEAVTTGRVPDNQVAYGKQIVLERFATSNVYFVIDKLVSGAVKQIQRSIGKLGNTLGFIPGMQAITGLTQFFVEISLGYIDECCLGYTFYKKEQGAFKSAADGVAIYAQNWKKLLADAAKTMAMVVVGMIVIVLSLFVGLGLLFRLLHWPGFVAFVLACLVAWAIKNSFIDSYIMVKMMASYMEEAPRTVIAFDLYGTLCGISSKFKELWSKGQQEPQPAYAGAGSADGYASFPAGTAQPPDAAADAKPVFCGQCGVKNKRGVKFCGSCGGPLGGQTG